MYIQVRLAMENSEPCVDDVVDQPVACSWVRLKRKPKCKQLRTGDRILAFDVGQIHMAQCLLVVDLAARPPFYISDVYEDWHILDLGNGKVSDSVEQLCQIATTTKREQWSKVDYVVIEQQAVTNVKMVAMSHVLDAVIQMIGGPRARFASSVHKFNVFKTMTDMTLLRPEPKDKSVHTQKKIRKQNSIDLTAAMLNAIPNSMWAQVQLREISADKRDDIADAFIYASAYIYQNEPMV